VPNDACPDRAATDAADPAAPAGGEAAALVTFGHGTASQDDLVTLLRDAGVTSVVDVRRFPGSRRNPHVARDELERWLPAAGVAYRWEERLGGRRRGDPASAHVGLRDASFRAYADHLGTEEFRSAIADVLAEANAHAEVDAVAEVGARRVAVMCSESVWWRCHRRLIADHVDLLERRPVLHLFHDGRLAPHQPTDVVRVQGDRLVYDAGAPTLELGQM
jgi:uncharacterized protein (DUF488 family)